LDQHYKTRPTGTADYFGKFCGNRPTEFEDLAFEIKNKTSASKYKFAVKTIVSGRT